MAGRNVDVNVRYVLQTVDRGLRQAVGTTRDFSNVTRETTKQVDAALRANSRAWQDTARVAARAQRQVADEAASTSGRVDRSLEKQIVKLRKAGVGYKEISTAARGWGRSANETAAAIERAATKEVQAMDRVAEARKRLRRVMTLGLSGGTSGGGRGGLTEERSLERGVLGAASSRARLGASAIGGGLVGGIAGYLGISAIKDAAQGTTELVKNAEQLHAFAGLSRQTAAEFVAVADAYGVSSTKLAQTFRTLGTAVTTQLTKPTTTTKQEFKALGITTDDLRKRQGNLQALLGLVADRLNKMPAGAEKTALAGKLLGRSWQSLSPMLEAGSKTMNDQLASAKALGVELGGNSAKNAMKLHEATIELKIAQKGLEVQFTEHVLPALLKAAEFGLKLFAVLRKALGPAVHFVTTEVKDAAHWLKEHKNVLHGVEIAAGALATTYVGLKVIGAIGRLARGVASDYRTLKSGISGVTGLFSRQESESAALVKSQMALADANSKLATSYDEIAASAKAAGGSEALAGEAGAVSGGGVVLPPGSSAARTAETSALATEGELAAGTAGVVGAGRFAGLAGGLFKGLGIAGIGLMGSQMAGSLIGGRAGSLVSGVGTGASLGAGLGSIVPGVGTIAGGIAGGLVGLAGSTGIGQSLMNLVTGSNAQTRATALISDAQKKINKASEGTLRNLQARLAASEKERGVTAKQASALQRAINQRGMQIVAPRLQSTIHDIATSKYAPNATQIFQRTTQDLFGLPRQLQNLGAQAMIKFAGGLESKGKLAKGTTNQLIGELETLYGPKLTTLLGKNGADSMQAIVDSIKQSKVLGTVQDQIDTIHKKWSAVVPATKVTTGNLVSVVSDDMSRLKGIIANSTGKQHDEAVAAYKALQKNATSTLGAMVNTLSAQQRGLRNSISHNSASARDAATKNFGQMAQKIGAAVGSGVEATGTGIVQISKALNATLTAFGGSQVPGVLKIGQTVVNAAKTVQGFVSGKAQGGRVPGPVGPDNWMLIDPSGRPAAMVGGSEMLIANRHTEARVDGMLSYFGTSLDREVASESRMHSFAQGGRLRRAALGLSGSRANSGAGGGGSVIDMHPGDMVQGQEPQILSDLYALSRRVAQPVYVISGYRTPAHSVAVGGFADDPHTRGQAADIGIGAPLLSTMYGLPEATLRAVGLYRPFFPPSASEANHVQLLAGGAAGAGAGLGAGGAAVTVPQIKAPTVTGSGTIARAVRLGLGKLAEAANKKAQKLATAYGGSAFSGTLSGPVPHQVFQFMKANGFNKIAIAGMLGNAMQESSMNPNAPGGGLWQQISNFGSGTGGSLLNQMQTMLPQIVGIRGAMNAAGSPGQAAVIFEQGFERAGIPAMSNRIAAANSAYAAGYARGGRLGRARGGRVDPPGTLRDAEKRAIAAMRAVNAPITYLKSKTSSPTGTASNLKAQSAFRVNASSEVVGGQGAFGFSPGAKSGGRGYSILSGTGLSSDPGPYGIALGPGVWKPPSSLIFKRGNRRSGPATLQDIGAGDNSRPTIGLYPTTIRELGGQEGSDLSGVEIERADGHKFTAMRSTAVKAFARGGRLAFAQHGHRLHHHHRHLPPAPHGSTYVPTPGRSSGSTTHLDYTRSPSSPFYLISRLAQILHEIPILTSPHDYGAGHPHLGSFDPFTGSLNTLASHGHGHADPSATNQFASILSRIHRTLGTVRSTSSPAKFKEALDQFGKELGHVDAIPYRHLISLQQRLRKQIRETSAFKHPDEVKHLEAELKKTKKGTDEAKKLTSELKTARESAAEEARLQAALKAVDVAAKKRVGTLVRHAEGQAAALDGANTRLQRMMTRRGIDSASTEGARMILRFDERSTKVLRNTVGSLRHAEKLAEKAHNPQEAAAIRGKLKAALDKLDQAVTDRVAQHRTLIETAAQDVVDSAAHRSTMVQSRLQFLETEQQISGTAGTAGGARQIAAYIQEKVLPALEGERDALRKQEAKAKSVGDFKLARQIAEAIASKNNDIESEKLDRLTAIRDATQATAQNTAELGGQLGVGYGGDQLPDLAGMLNGA